MVPSVFKCSKCDFRGNHSFWDQYVYDVDGKLAEIPRSEGWCRDCASTSIIEDLSFAKDVPAVDYSDQSNNSEMIASTHEIGQVDSKPKSWFARLFESKADRLARQKRESERVRQELQALRKRRRSEREQAYSEEYPFADEILQKVSERPRGLNRCLVCGGISVHIFNQQSNESHNDSRWPHFMHPGCGGYLYPENVEVQIHPSLRRKHYSVEGEFLFEEPFDFGRELFKGTPFERD